jgi:hypothetical protein
VGGGYSRAPGYDRACVAWSETRRKRGVEVKNVRYGTQHATWDATRYAARLAVVTHPAWDAAWRPTWAAPQTAVRIAARGATYEVWK